MKHELTESLKGKALDMGVNKVGIASRENLAGPPEADTGNILPGAKAVISFLVVEPEVPVMNYLSKVDAGEYRDHFYENHRMLGRVGLSLARELQSLGFRAVPLSPNGVYAEGSSMAAGLKPPFSHRYAAVAAGLGAIGLSGNLGAPEYGSRVHLGSVICDAPLVPDEPLDSNPCDECGLCLRACPGMFMSFSEVDSFTMGGREITHAGKGLHMRCGISCGGFTGLSHDGKWGTWAPATHLIPEDDGELMKLLAELAASYFQKRARNPGLPNFVRLSDPMPGYPEHQQGILARTRLDTHTTCGNCALVCFETREKRATALKALHGSGFVFEDEDGNAIVEKSLEQDR